MNPLERATLAQNEASDPRHSSFVSANAGSGKTTILTNRIVRLLLRGAAPTRILCITYTKAAAGEVQNRVFKQLAKWVLISDEELRNELAKIGETSVSGQRLSAARRLFAQALETPGGLKIQTIHAFAASVLRRFPLEAGVPPGFQEMGDAQTDEYIHRAIQSAILDFPDKAKEWVSYSLLSVKGADIVKHAKGFSVFWNAQEFSDWFGFGDLLTEQEALKQFLSIGAEILAESVMQCGKKDIVNNWSSFQQLVDNREYDALIKWLQLYTLTKSGQLVAPLVKRRGDSVFVDGVERMFARISETNLCRRAVALQEFGKVVLEKYQESKSRNSRLDYEDLISYCESLLNQNDRLNWVMYRLDGAIEHILIDEAQDTNSLQWGIVDSLIKGTQNASSIERSLFVVGDEKQSIFGFQGADAEIFQQKQIEYEGYLKTLGQDLYQGALQLSFRSSPLILRYVDQVFKTEISNGLGNDIAHEARSEDIPGEVEIWPYYAEDEEASVPLWPDNIIQPKTSAEIELAQDVAQMIADEIRDGRIIQDGDVARQVRPGDYLILVRSRRAFYTHVQKQLQKHGVPIAGVDKLRLNEELAVKDIIALLRAVAAPFDELSLASFLRSPLGGISEEQLFELAHRRGETSLVSRLFDRQAEFPDACAMYEYVRQNADFLRPFDIIQTLISKFDGVAKLASRLGPSVSDAIDALLGAARNFENEATPSLVGFLDWFDNLDIDVKRQLINDGSAVRVMTVHGAKGLEAPIVILPQVDGSDRGDRTSVIVHKGIALPRVSKIDGLTTPAMLIDILDARKQKSVGENNRLLYVGLTRARTRLVICGTGKLLKDCSYPKTSFYPILMDAMSALDGKCISVESAKGVKKVLRHGNVGEFKESTPPVKKRERHNFEALNEAGDGLVKSMSLSSLLPDLDADSIAMGRGAEFGTAVHNAIERWPFVVENHGFPAAQTEAARVMGTFPELAREFVFEVDVAFEVAGRQVHGRIDAINFGDEIRVVDFKTNLETHQEFEEISVPYQYQLAFYYKAILSAFPGRIVSAEIIWTSNLTRLVASAEQLDLAFAQLESSLARKKVRAGL